MIEQYLEDKDNHFYYKGQGQLKVYIPKSFIDSSLCKKKSDHIQVFGVVPVAVCDKDGKIIKAEVLNCPYMMNFYNLDLVTEKDINFFKEDDKRDYDVLTFFDGEKVMDSAMVCSNDNLDALLDYVLGAKILNYVKFDHIPSLMSKCLIDNKINMPIPNSILEIISNAVLRKKGSSEETYGQYLAKHKDASPYGYEPANVRAIVAKSSISTSLAFEDMNSAIVMGVNTTAYDKKQPKSPIEKILTM